jgi:hypothetical protein
LTTSTWIVITNCAQAALMYPGLVNCGSGYSGASSGPAAGSPTPKQLGCLGDAIKKNGVALALDAAGVGAGFLPGGDLVVAGVQMGIGAASTVNSAIGGDAPGAVTGIAGFQLSAMVPAARWGFVGAKAVPFLGAVVSAAGGLNDLWSSCKDYQSCMAGL